MLKEVIKKYKFDKSADRLGPDLVFSHWKLYFKTSMRKLCKAKFKHFADTAEIRPGVYVIGCSKISIGERVILRPTTMLFADPRPNGAGIVIENDVLTGSGVHFYVNNHRFDNSELPIIDQGHSASDKIVVRKGAWIGANAILLPGVEIGENTVVAAGTVVTKSIPPGVVVAGVPAKIIKRIS